MPTTARHLILALFIIGIQWALALPTPTPSPTPTVSPTPTASPTPTPTPGPNKCQVTFTCMADEKTLHNNCGTNCTCPAVSSAAPGWVTLICTKTPPQTTCNGTMPPNSFNPAVQRGQCGRFFAMDWLPTGVNATCSPGKSCPNSNQLKPALPCTGGATSMVQATCS